MLLSPIGLSVTAQLAPNAFRAQMMALYFAWWAWVRRCPGVLSRYSAEHEVAYFGIIGAVAVAVGVVVWLIAPRVSALMDGVHWAPSRAPLPPRR